MKTSHRKRLARLESVSESRYKKRADEAYQTGRITAEQRELFLRATDSGNVIPPDDIDTDVDGELAEVLRKLAIWMPIFEPFDENSEPTPLNLSQFVFKH